MPKFPYCRHLKPKLYISQTNTLFAPHSLCIITKLVWPASHQPCCHHHRPHHAFKATPAASCAIFASSFAKTGRKTPETTAIHRFRHKCSVSSFSVRNLRAVRRAAAIHKLRQAAACLQSADAKALLREFLLVLGHDVFGGKC